MTMTNYISLDGKKYFTPNGTWKPNGNKPMTVRNTLLGSLDVTYGSMGFKLWEGEIEGPVTASGVGYGTIDDLRTVLNLRQGITFIDHYGQTYTVHAQGPFPERSNTPKWDSPENIMYIAVRLVAE